MNKKHVCLTLLLLFIAGSLTAQVSKTVFIPKAGELKSQFTEEEAGTITQLTLTGKINAKDFKALRDEFTQLQYLDISNAEIRMYTGKEGTYPDKIYVYPFDCVPAYAFAGKQSLQTIILSPSIKNLEDNAFADCHHLKICQIKKKTPPNLLSKALSDSLTAIFIPLGSRDVYKVKKGWSNFAFVEGDPLTMSIHVTTGGNLLSEIKKQEKKPEAVNFLTLTGNPNEADYKLIREEMPNLVFIDLSGTSSTSIPDYTFSQKKCLLRAILPKGLVHIGERVFSGCIRLSGELLLPATINNIGYGTFMGCDNLQKIVVQGKKPEKLGENIFGEEGVDKFIYRN